MAISSWSCLLVAGRQVNTSQLSPPVPQRETTLEGLPKVLWKPAASTASTVSLCVRRSRTRLTLAPVDWEHPADPQQGADFLALLSAIRLHLPDEDYLLTAALPAGEWALRNIDLCRAQDYLDLINLMAYDFAGSWSPTAGHHAQLYPGNPDEPSGSAAVDYILSAGFPASKILLGVPVYGRSFFGANAAGASFNGCGGEEGTFEYKELPRHDAEEVVNTRVVGAFCTGGDGGFVSYDNPATVKIKASYALEKGLGVSHRALHLACGLCPTDTSRACFIGQVQQMRVLVREALSQLDSRLSMEARDLSIPTVSLFVPYYST